MCSRSAPYCGKCSRAASCFVGDTVSDTLAAVLRATPDYDELPADTPPALRALLKRCLEKEVKQRLRDIGEARITLDRIKAGDTGVAETAADGGGVMSKLRAYGGWIATAVVIVVSIIMMQRGGSGPVTTAEPELPVVKFAIPMAN